MNPQTEAKMNLILQNQQLESEKKVQNSSTTIGKQILIYLVSFFLPPFGLKWAFSYLRSDDEKAQKIGIFVIFLTIVSLVVNFIIIKDFISSFTQSLPSQTDLYGF